MAAHRVWSGQIKRPRKRVLFDSSFLIAVMESPTPWRQDILEKLGAYEPVVIRPVYEELVGLSSKTGRSARFGALAKGLVDNGYLILAEPTGNGPADDELVSSALEDGAVVATLDKRLIRQLRGAGISVISLSRGRVSM